MDSSAVVASTESRNSRDRRGDRFVGRHRACALADDSGRITRLPDDVVRLGFLAICLVVWGTMLVTAYLARAITRATLPEETKATPRIR